MTTQQNTIYGLTEHGKRYVLSQGIYCELCGDCIKNIEDAKIFMRSGICPLCQAKRNEGALLIEKLLAKSVTNNKAIIVLKNAIRYQRDRRFEEDVYITRIGAELQEMAVQRYARMNG